MSDSLELLGATLEGRYRLERELGRGGMAIVYLAEDCRQGRRVALKVLRREVAASLGSDRFLREIEIASHLTHPHILPLYDSGEAAGYLYYAMPCVDGGSLRDRLRREKQLPVEESLKICREIADALDHAHGLGVVHRDIKPENVLFQGGHAVLSDFGVARAISEAGAAHLTESGFAVGTPAYMSPEQAGATEPLDGRSDVYALGCVLYEMLAGEPPYTGPTAQVIMAKQLADPVPAVRRLRQTVPAGVDRALMTALAKVPADRFPTAGAFARALTAPVLAEPAQRSVAVLPFIDLGRDPENEYFADGITEDVIAHLSKIRDLRVISRASVMPFKKRQHALGEIATRLKVETLLEGSVRRAGDRVRIVAQLIEAATDRNLWAETYDRHLSDIFEIQSDVAMQIAGALKAELSTGEKWRIRKEATGNVTAYHLYLRGRHCLLRVTAEGIRQGLQYFEEAIAEDPHYALAWTGITLGCVFLALGYGAGSVRPPDAHRRGREAALRALELDPDLAEAHALHAIVLFMLEFDWNGAEHELAKAVELNPGTDFTWDAYGMMLSALERYDEAIRAIRHARDLDPLTAVHSSDLATVLLRAGRYDEAEREARHLIELQPDFPHGHSTLGWTYMKKHRYEDGLPELERAVELNPGDTMFLAQLGQGYAIAGRTVQARDVLRQLEQLARQRYVSPYHMAYVYTGLNEPETALDWLERAFDERAGGIYGIKGSFLFTTLHSHPRFVTLLRQMNLA